MRDENCIFCKIANGEIPSATVYEDEDFRAILDLGPANAGHTLILPKNHYANLAELPDALAGRVLAVARKIGLAQQKALAADGFNVLQNNGTAAGQSVFHYHVHVIPRYEGDNAVPNWTPGSYADGEMDETAKKLQEAL